MFVAVDEVIDTVSRAIQLGGGTAQPLTTEVADVGDYAALVDPDGTHVAVLQSRLGRHGYPGDVPGTRERNGT